MDFDYVALKWTVDHLGGAPHCYGDRIRLLNQGWEEVCRAPWEPKGLGITGGACIMRSPKDEPRMWTKAELWELMKETWVVSESTYLKEE